MTTVDAAIRPPAGSDRATPALWVGVVAAAAATVLLPDQDWSRSVVAALLAISLVSVILLDRTLGILATTGYLATLGLDRRLVSMALPDPSHDPLLLVAPIAVTALVLLSTRERVWRRPTALTFGVAAGFLLTVVAVANPILGPSANLRGALFWSVPMLWFAIGRGLDEAVVRRILRLVAGLGLGACATGVYQATVGFPRWDQRWIDHRGYTALGINGPDTLRPFGWSSSAGEFALTAAIVMVLCAVGGRAAARTKAWPQAIGFGGGLVVAGAALGLSGVRTALVLGVAALVVVALAASGAGIVRLTLALVFAAVAIAGGARLLDVRSWEGDGAVGLARRSLVGLSDPLGSDSTLRSHLDLTEGALRTLDDRPLGAGTAYGTTDAPEDPGLHVAPAENDLGNAALAFGILGVVMVLGVTILGLRAGWLAARAGPTFVALAALGILVASLRFWWTGAQYATAPLVWLALGWTDRPEP